MQHEPQKLATSTSRETYTYTYKGHQNEQHKNAGSGGDCKFHLLGSPVDGALDPVEQPIENDEDTGTIEDNIEDGDTSGGGTVILDDPVFDFDPKK